MDVKLLVSILGTIIITLLGILVNGMSSINKVQILQGLELKELSTKFDSLDKCVDYLNESIEQEKESLIERLREEIKTLKAN